MVDILTIALTGFATGIGTGIANWLIIKRLDHIESKIRNQGDKK